MEFNTREACTLLSTTPNVLFAWFAGVPDEWAHGAEYGEEWSPFDIVGHLIHGERTDWIPRACTILEHGESRPFEPFDRFAQKRDSAGKTMDGLLDEFAALRATNLATWNRLDLSDLDKTGTHPEFGVVTLRQLLATWVVHDLSHLRQIARVMAKRYTDEVGPWRAYLPVLG